MYQNGAPNMLIVYDHNYQEYVRPVINSAIENTREINIFGVITSDVTIRFKPEKVYYYVNDPPQEFGNYKVAKHITKSRAPYNYIYGLPILFAQGVRKIILSDVDAVHLKSLDELYSWKVDPKTGFAGSLSPCKHVLNMLVGFSNLQITPEILKKCRRYQAVSMASMVIDLNIFFNSGGYTELVDIIQQNDIGEMAAINFFLKGRVNLINPKFVTDQAIRTKPVEDIYSLDWRGKRKPWNSKVNYLEQWKKFDHD